MRLNVVNQVLATSKMALVALKDARPLNGAVRIRLTRTEMSFQIRGKTSSNFYAAERTSYHIIKERDLFRYEQNIFQFIIFVCLI
jgi:hypothetical protein